jgi:hypothetical protein
MADAAPTVTFPDDYPNSVRHFLLIGFLGMFIGAIVFFYMGISRKVNTISHVLTFFIAAVASCSYYAMWAGLGVEYKTTDTTPRVIFWARYLDWIITLPVRIDQQRRKSEGLWMCDLKPHRDQHTKYFFSFYFSLLQCFADYFLH